MSENVLAIDNLKTYFYTDQGVARAVDGVSLSVEKGKTLAVVGESGCGKSVTALSVMRLIASPPGKIVEGSIRFEGKELASLSQHEMRAIRGNDISMIFQEPMTSLNPVFRVGKQIGAVLRLHRGLSKDAARDAAIELLRHVGIPSPESRISDYPHQMSGGMRQRVMIAMALACDPVLLIADEPTTALDVTVQAQILDLLRGLQQERGMALMLITHDLGVVAEIADDVAVMYAGQIVEYAPVRELFHAPKHPYTVGLFKALPKLQLGRLEQERLHIIEGRVPPATHFPPACRFHPRCPYVMDVCRETEPHFEDAAPGHGVKCWLHDEPHMKSLGRPAGLPEEIPIAAEGGGEPAP